MKAVQHELQAQTFLKRFTASLLHTALYTLSPTQTQVRPCLSSAATIQSRTTCPHSLRVKVQTISPGSHPLLAVPILAVMPSGISLATILPSATSSKCKTRFRVS